MINNAEYIPCNIFILSNSLCADIFLIRTSLYSGHLSDADTSLIR